MIELMLIVRELLCQQLQRLARIVCFLTSLLWLVVHLAASMMVRCVSIGLRAGVGLERGSGGRGEGGRLLSRYTAY